MNVPERTSVTFFLPLSNTSAYTAIVSITIVPRRILAHTQYLESKHQGGVRYGCRTKLDENTEAIANRSDLTPGRCQCPGFFQDHEVFNVYLSFSFNSSFDPKNFHAVLCFNNIKPARSHTFYHACPRVGFTCSTPNLAVHSSFFWNLGTLV